MCRCITRKITSLEQARYWSQHQAWAHPTFLFVNPINVTVVSTILFLILFDSFWYCGDYYTKLSFSFLRHSCCYPVTLLATFMLTPKIGHAKSCLYNWYLICHKCSIKGNEFQSRLVSSHSKRARERRPLGQCFPTTGTRGTRKVAKWVYLSNLWCHMGPQIYRKHDTGT